MNSSNFLKGDILEANSREPTKGFHYIVYIEGYSDLDFCGCMITHTNNKRNVSMKPVHFEKNDENGNRFKVTYDNTFLVKGKFLKSEEWGPFEKVGSLTKVGIQFLDNETKNIDSETFRDYYRRNRFAR